MIATTGLRGLRVSCIVGVYPAERESPQPIVIDVELDYDASRAAVSDEIGDAVDYDRVAHGLTELIERRGFRLLETMAHETADMLLTEHPLVQTLRLEIRKPNAVADADCSFVRLERSRG